MKGLLKLLSILLLLSFFSLNAQVLNLSQGWNNIGIANETSISEFENSHVSYIWQYSPDTGWEVWSPDTELMNAIQSDINAGRVGYNLIDHIIQPNEALWIYDTQTEVVRIGETGVVSSIHGIVKSATDNTLINDFNISLNGQVYSFDNNGTFNITNIPLGLHTMIIHADGFQDANYSLDLESEVPQDLGQIYMVSSTASSNDINISGTVINSVTGSGVANARVRFYNGYDNINGTPVADVSTDDSGNYSVNIPAGLYTVYIVDSGYYTYRVNYSFVNTNDSSNSTSHDFALTPELSNDTNNSVPLRVVLSWGETPTDLDSHLMAYEDGIAFDNNCTQSDNTESNTTENNNSTQGNSCVDNSSYFNNPNSSHWYVYYGNKHAPGDIAQLDVDDTDSFGPETVTMQDVNNSLIYKYYVYNWSNETPLKDSHAHVVIFYNGREYDMNVPNEDGRVWKVFEIKNGIISPCVENCMSDMSSAGGVPTYDNIYNLRPLSQGGENQFLKLIFDSYRNGK